MWLDFPEIGNGTVRFQLRGCWGNNSFQPSMELRSRPKRSTVTPFFLKSSLRCRLFTKNVRNPTNVKIDVQHCKRAVYLWGVFEFIPTENQVFSFLTTN